MDSTDISTSRLFNSRKNKIIATLVAAAVLLGVGLLFYSIAVGPSKQPYRTALTQYKNVYNANINLITLGGSLNSGTATDEAFAKSIKALKRGLASLSTENRALAKQAVLQNGEGKVLYESFSKRVGEYVAFNDDMIASMEKVRPVVFGCSSKMSVNIDNSDGVNEMRSCAEGLAAVGDVPNPQYKTYAAEASAQYEALAQNFEKRLAIATTEYAEGYDPKQALDDERDQIVESLGEIGSRFAKDLNAAKAKVDITEVSMALDKYLKKKSSIF